MSFWKSEMGEITGSENDAFAKSFKIIPDGTMALAKIDNFIMAEYNGNRYLSIDWSLIDGDFKGQKVNQKLKVFDNDAKVKHRALNMLKLIYQLFGYKPTHSNAPTDHELSFFSQKQAGIKIRETEPNAEGKQYNWVSEVHKAQGFKCETGVKLVVEHVNSDLDSAFSRNPKREDLGINELDDDIPF